MAVSVLAGGTTDERGADDSATGTCTVTLPAFAKVKVIGISEPGYSRLVVCSRSSTPLASGTPQDTRAPAAIVIERIGVGNRTAVGPGDGAPTDGAAIDVERDVVPVLVVPVLPDLEVPVRVELDVDVLPGFEATDELPPAVALGADEGDDEAEAAAVTAAASEVLANAPQSETAGEEIEVSLSACEPELTRTSRMDTSLPVA